HERVIVFPSVSLSPFDASDSLANLVEVSLGSVPSLKYAVYFILSGVYSLARFVGSVFSSTVTLTTVSGFVNFSFFVKILFAKYAFIFPRVGEPVLLVR